MYLEAVNNTFTYFNLRGGIEIHKLVFLPMINMPRFKQKLKDILLQKNTAMKYNYSIICSIYGRILFNRAFSAFCHISFLWPDFFPVVTRFNPTRE